MFSISSSICRKDITCNYPNHFIDVRDQTNQLNKKGITAAFLGSAQPDKSLEGTVFFGNIDIKVLFVTLEWLFSSNKLALVKEMSESGKLGLVAIDEAHLVSDWNTFRGKYGQLVNIKKELPNIPLWHLQLLPLLMFCVSSVVCWTMLLFYKTV